MVLTVLAERSPEPSTMHRMPDKITLLDTLKTVKCALEAGRLSLKTDTKLEEWAKQSWFHD